MAAPTTVPNGNAADAPIDVTSPTVVVGINFGNSYASIAVITNEGSAECIANEDGERQIACAIAFHGEETYIGNHAKPQLVKNSHNTITGFRNLLGKKFSEIPQDKISISTPVIQHPTLPDTPAYKVTILQPAPKPLPTSSLPSHLTSPAASHAPTPRSEPTPIERILTPSEVTTLFLRSLLQSAEDFLGRKVDGGVVITVPGWFDDAQREALGRAAEEAGVRVLQLLEEAGAATVLSTVAFTKPEPGVEMLIPDRTQLIVDLGASSLSLSLLSIRHGLAHTLGSLRDESVGGDAIDDKLIKFFARDFVKKTGTPLRVCPAGDAVDRRAEAKLRLAVEHTKRTLSASTGAATCSVESLKEGMDYTGSINRMRFDLEVRGVYERICEDVRALLEGVDAEAGAGAGGGGWEPLHVDEIVYVGGSASLPGLDEALSLVFPEETASPFKAGTVVGGGVGDPTTILVRGCALQAKLLAGILEGEEEVRAAFGSGSGRRGMRVTGKTLGVLFPEEGVEDALGGQWIAVVLKETPVPSRRVYAFEVDLGEEDGEGERKVGFEVWEVNEGVKVEKIKPPKVELEEGDEGEEEEEEEEEEEVREKTIEKDTHLGSVEFVAKEAKKEKGRWKTKIEVQFVVGRDAALEVSAWEIRGTHFEMGEKTIITIPAHS